jgi:hypothetical protein
MGVVFMCVLGALNGIACLKRRSFDPAAFFSYQRILGMDPYVRGGSIGFRLADNVAASCLHKWADENDPGGRARHKYAAMAWKSRSPNQKIVSLGNG